jgi:tRNA nucleotidyltransferase (CCA-adding enzyme)
LQAFENHIQWTTVKDVAKRLREAGFMALLAGGSVRDLVMGREPNDFDIATSATPDEVAELFPQALEVGKAFGVSILPFKDFQVEVATFREDLEYLDGRRPEGVRFSSPEADARRRDFTVNALFLDLETSKVIDYVGGEVDIRARVIRTVGEPARRFHEDRLRLLRAVRFAAQLGFTIAEETFHEVQRQAPEITIVSRERVRDELLKLLKSPGRVRGLELLETSGLLAAAFPELFKAIAHQGDEWLKSFQTLTGLSLTKLEPTALLSLFYRPLYLVDPAHLKDQLRSLRLDTHLMDDIQFVLRSSGEFSAPETVRRGSMALLCAHRAASSCEVFVEALEQARGVSREVIEERRGYLRDLKRIALTAEGAKPEPLVSGNDAKAAGFLPGPQMGAALNEAYLLQLEGRFLDREEALHWLKAENANE